MKLADNNDYGLLLWGTKQGQKGFSWYNLVDKTGEDFSHGEKINRNLKDPHLYLDFPYYNQRDYVLSYECTANYYCYTIYKPIYDWVNRLGYYCISIFIPIDKEMSTEAIPALLVEMAALYEQKYIASTEEAPNPNPNQIKRTIKEDISIFLSKLRTYPLHKNKLPNSTDTNANPIEYITFASEEDAKEKFKTLRPALRPNIKLLYVLDARDGGVTCNRKQVTLPKREERKLDVIIRVKDHNISKSYADVKVAIKVNNDPLLVKKTDSEGLIVLNALSLKDNIELELKDERYQSNFNMLKRSVKELTVINDKEVALNYFVTPIPIETIDSKTKLLEVVITVEADGKNVGKGVPFIVNGHKEINAAEEEEKTNEKGELKLSKIRLNTIIAIILVEEHTVYVQDRAVKFDVAKEHQKERNEQVDKLKLFFSIDSKALSSDGNYDIQLPLLNAESKPFNLLKSVKLEVFVNSQRYTDYKTYAKANKVDVNNLKHGDKVIIKVISPEECIGSFPEVIVDKKVQRKKYDAIQLVLDKPKKKNLIIPFLSKIKQHPYALLGVVGLLIIGLLYFIISMFLGREPSTTQKTITQGTKKDIDNVIRICQLAPQYTTVDLPEELFQLLSDRNLGYYKDTILNRDSLEQFYYSDTLNKLLVAAGLDTTKTFKSQLDTIERQLKDTTQRRVALTQAFIDKVEQETNKKKKGELLKDSLHFKNIILNLPAKEKYWAYEQILGKQNNLLVNLNKMGNRVSTSSTQPKTRIKAMPQELESEIVNFMKNASFEGDNNGTMKKIKGYQSKIRSYPKTSNSIKDRLKTYEKASIYYDRLKHIHYALKDRGEKEYMKLKDKDKFNDDFKKMVGNVTFSINEITSQINSVLGSNNIDNIPKKEIKALKEKFIELLSEIKK